MKPCYRCAIPTPKLYCSRCAANNQTQAKRLLAYKLKILAKYGLLFAMTFVLLKNQNGDWVRYYPPVKSCTPGGYVELVSCQA